MTIIWKWLNRKWVAISIPLCVCIFLTSLVSGPRDMGQLVPVAPEFDEPASLHAFGDDNSSIPMLEDDEQTYKLVSNPADHKINDRTSHTDELLVGPASTTSPTVLASRKRDNHKNRKQPKRKKKGNAKVNEKKSSTIDRLVYFNSFANPKRRHFMEDWISSEVSQYSTNLDVLRIEPIHANRTKTANLPAIVGGDSISRSYLRLLQDLPDMPDYNTLILKDDATSVTNLSKLESIISRMPSSWHAIQLDCDQRLVNAPTTERYSMHSLAGPSGKKLDVPVHSNAILFRGIVLQKLIKHLSPKTDLPKMLTDAGVEGMFGGMRFRIICVNAGITNTVPMDDDTPYQPVEGVYSTAYRRNRSNDGIRMEIKAMPSILLNKDARIDKIIYLNLPKNVWRNRLMEDWLSEQSIPYKRMDAVSGSRTECAPNVRSERRCMGISGLLFTLANIIDTQNMTGTTLILEDDMTIVDKNLGRLELALQLVPDDWDIIRIDTWGLQFFSMNRPNKYVANTTEYWPADICEGDQPKESCYYPMNGGTHAMLFREGSVHKLRQLWMTKPYQDADLNIAGEIGGGQFNITSYSLQIDIFRANLLRSEVSDISKSTNDG